MACSAYWYDLLTILFVPNGLELNANFVIYTTRGGTIHRCIDISRYFSRDTYRDIIFYNQDFFSSTMIFIWAEKRHNNIYMRFLQSNSSNT